jgi:hypothetical protein
MLNLTVSKRLISCDKKNSFSRNFANLFFLCIQNCLLERKCLQKKQTQSYLEFNERVGEGGTFCFNRLIKETIV